VSDAEVDELEDTQLLLLARRFEQLVEVTPSLVIVSISPGWISRTNDAPITSRPATQKRRPTFGASSRRGDEAQRRIRRVTHRVNGVRSRITIEKRPRRSRARSQGLASVWRSLLRARVVQHESESESIEVTGCLLVRELEYWSDAVVRDREPDAPRNEHGCAAVQFAIPTWNSGYVDDERSGERAGRVGEDVADEPVVLNDRYLLIVESSHSGGFLPRCWSAYSESYKGVRRLVPSNYPTTRSFFHAFPL